MIYEPVRRLLTADDEDEVVAGSRAELTAPS